MALPSGRVTNDPTNYFAVALQSGKDVDGTTFYYLKHLDGTGFDVSVDVSSERVGGSGREIGLRYRTKVMPDGQYVAYSQADLNGRALYHALGNDTVTGTAPGGNSIHFLTSLGASNVPLPYYTVEQGYADETERTTNCQTKSLKFEGEAGRPVKMTVQFISGGTPHYQATALTPTRESGFPIMQPGASIAITAVGQLTGGLGATSLQVTKWSLEIANQLDDAIQTVALNREDVLWLNADYNLDGTFKYINRDFWNAVTYGGQSQVPTGFLTSGAFTFYSPTPSQTALTLFCPFVEFTSWKLNRLDPDGKTMYFDYVAATKNIGTQSLQATVLSPAANSYSLTTT